MVADTLEYSTLREEDEEEVVTFMAEHFYPREPLSTMLHMTYDDSAEWIHGAVRGWVQDGVSVVARDPDTGEVAGTLLATILTRYQNKSFEEAVKSPKPKVATLHAVLSFLEEAVTFFERFDVDKILELAMITVSEAFSGKGVGRRLVKEGETRGIQLGCQLGTAQATAIPSQRLLDHAGYTSLYTMDYASFEVDGCLVFDMDRSLGSPSAKVMARLLQENHQQNEELLNAGVALRPASECAQLLQGNHHQNKDVPNAPAGVDIQPTLDDCELTEEDKEG